MAKFKIMMTILLLVFAALPTAAQTVSLESPQDGDDCVALDAVVSWDVVGGSSTFTVEISKTEDFSDIAWDTTGIETLQTTINLDDYDYTFFWKVTATFTNNASVSSPVGTFTTSPPPPRQLTPQPSQACVPLSVEFTWEDVPRAQTYSLEYANNLAFSNSTVIDDLSGTSATVVMPDYDTQIFWRMKTVAGATCESPWSQTLEFTTKRRAPTLINPQNNAIGIPLNANLTWGGATAADSYRVQISKDQNFTDPVFIDTNGVVDQFLQIVLDQYDHTYYWRASATYSDCLSNWSDVSSFTTQYEPPTADYPANGSSCVGMETTFTWTEVPNAEEYDLQVSVNSDFSSPEVNETGIESAFFKTILEESITKYFWRVRANDDNNTGKWSNSSTFTSSIHPPDHVFPDDGLTGLPLDVKLIWDEDVSGAVYELQIATSTNFANDLVASSGTLTEPSYSLTLNQNNTEYFWRLRANYGSCTSLWSNPWKFTTVVGPPELVSPEDSAKNTSLKPYFTWKISKGATSYDIQVGSDPDFNVYIGKKGTPANGITLNNAFEVNSQYWWRVRAKNTDGESLWSEVRTFTTGGQGPEIPVLISPEHESEMVSTTPSMSWSASDRADSYIIQISDNIVFAAPLAFEAENISATSVSVSELEYYTEYWWRVAAVNDSGQSRFSDPWKFRTIAQEIEIKPDLRTPGDGMERLDIEVLFSWFEIEIAERYQLQVAKDQDFSDIVNDLDRVYDEEESIYGFDYQTKYYWRVRGWNETGNGPWSDVWSFETKEDPGSVSPIGHNPFSAKILPNPSDGGANLLFELPRESQVNILIYDLNGKVVKNISEGYMQSGNHLISIDAQILGSGSYLLVIETQYDRETKQLIITK